MQHSTLESSTVWQGEPERLDRALAAAGLARSRSHATELIGLGNAFINGVAAAKPGVKVHTGAALAVQGSDHYVSRGAHKLVAALDAFGIDPHARLALDLGASTGGFTHVLLERGAREVLAVDVGHGQLAEQIRRDARVRVVEGCNARNLDAAMLKDLTGMSEQPSLVVADLSFISLTLIFPAIARCVAEGAELALLIKPQFEVGRVKDGIVTDPKLWELAVLKVLQSAAENGFGVRGIAPSPIEGTEGNREFLVHLVRTDAPDPGEWEGRVRELCTPQQDIRERNDA